MKGLTLLVSVPVVVFLGLVVAAFVRERRRVASGAARRRHRGHRRSRAVVPALPEPATEVETSPVVAIDAPVLEVAPEEALSPEIESLLAELATSIREAPAAADPEPVDAAVEVQDPPAPSAAIRPADPLRHWGLREPAFDNAPSTRFLYLSPEHTEALFRLRYAIRHRKGCAVLTGNYGCGKTTLARALARELDAARFDVALIANPLLTPAALLQEVLHQLGVETAAKDKPALLRALEGRLVENYRRGRDTVVIVDEAQLIEDAAVFNELRLLLNFQTNDRFLLTLVLAGSDELRETLRRQPHLAQRCVVRASLVPLDREQTGRYIRHRLITAGREAETLTEDAVDELFATTGGTPRVINAVCDLTLFVGAAAGARRVDRELIRQVAGDIIPAHAA